MRLGEPCGVNPLELWSPSCAASPTENSTCVCQGRSSCSWTSAALSRRRVHRWRRSSSPPLALTRDRRRAGRRRTGLATALIGGGQQQDGGTEEPAKPGGPAGRCRLVHVRGGNGCKQSLVRRSGRSGDQAGPKSPRSTRPRLFSGMGASKTSTTNSEVPLPSKSTS